MTKYSEPDRDGFSDDLHGLRGLAASAVVVFHALLIFRVGPFDDPHRLPFDFSSGWLVLNHLLIGLVNGHAAVILFFVLSGTVLSLSLARAPQISASVLFSYYIRRGFRLYPLLIATAIAAALLHFHYFQDVAFTATTTWMDGYYRHEPDLRETVLNAAGIRNTLNPPAWTITIEIAASLVFPLLYALSVNDRLVLPTLALLTALLFLPLPGLLGVSSYFVCFYLGALIPRVGAGAARRFRTLPRPLKVGSFIFALGIMGWAERVLAPTLHMDPVAVLAMTVAATFIVTIVYHAGGWKVLRFRFLRFLGEISYGIYLIHFGVLFVIAHAVAPRMHALPPHEALSANLALAAATLAITITLACVSYLVLERPCQQFGRKFSKRLTSSRAAPVERSKARA
jgi:peptidoglycan/LPS O-acetylase OafA/YrhL